MKTLLSFQSFGSQPISTTAFSSSLLFRFDAGGASPQLALRDNLDQACPNRPCLQLAPLSMSPLSPTSPSHDMSPLAPTPCRSRDGFTGCSCAIDSWPTSKAGAMGFSSTVQTPIRAPLPSFPCVHRVQITPPRRHCVQREHPPPRPITARPTVSREPEHPQSLMSLHYASTMPPLRVPLAEASHSALAIVIYRSSSPHVPWVPFFVFVLINNTLII